MTKRTVSPVLTLRRALVGGLLLAAAAASPARAANPFEPQPSTAPLGSAFYRHLAFDFGLDIRELVKLERRGFGRGEVVTLVLIAKTTGVNVKEYAKRRLKDKVPLKDLAAEAKLDYPTLHKSARAIKEGIESKGEENLPPPVYEPSPTPELPRRRRREKAAPTPAPTPSPQMENSPMPAPADTVAP